MPVRIMIVEDDLNLALLLQYNFEAAGYEVEHVERGDAAERRIAECRPDLVLLDWMLPGLSGLELCRRLRKVPVTRILPIIMVTARADRADHEFATRVGANDFITKPFSVGDVVSRARQQLDLREAVQPAA